MKKKPILTLAIFTIVVGFGAINLSTIKNLFITSQAAEFYVRTFRDGALIDQDHLVAKLHNGMSIIVNKYDRCVCWFVRLVGYWDSSETKAIGHLIKKGATVVEVGSNFGAHTLYMGDLVGAHGKVFAFEANPNVSKYLKQSVTMNKLDDRVQVFDMALSNKAYNGFMSYGVDNIGGGFILPESAETTAKCQDNSCTPIQVGVLDEVLRDQKVDVLKMDVEGAEFWVLEGAKHVLANPDLTLIMEWSTDHLRRNKVDIKAFVDLLKHDNFQVWAITRNGKLQPIDYASLESNASLDLVFSRNPNML